MVYDVVASPRTQERLAEAVAYIANELGLRRSAAALLDEFEKKCEALSALPNGFSIDEEASELIGITIRKIYVRSFKLLYHVDEQGGVVHLLTLRFKNADPATLASEDLSLN